MIAIYVNFEYHFVDTYAAKVMDSNVPATGKYILKLKKYRKIMRDALMLAKDHMARYYNKSVADHVDPKFKVGDQMMGNGKHIKTIGPT